VAKVIYSPEALEDLSRLVEFPEEKPGSAGAVVESILHAVGMLGAHPMLGRRLDRARRELVISRGSSGYLASYRFDQVQDAVLILRICHQREAGYLD
jgi:plasmid stabilization system protein ParE